MAIDKTVRYPGRWGAVSAEYPLGQPKNRTSPTAKDGTYLEKDWISDYEAFFASLMDNASFSANGLVDEVGASQFYDALLAVLKPAETQVITSSGTYTPTAGARAAKVTLVGGGGGAGGVAGVASAKALSQSGAGGGTSIKVITTFESSYSIVIGAGGAGGAAGDNAGATGGTSTFIGDDTATTSMSANGGDGGEGQTGTTGSVVSDPSYGGVATGGDINITGTDATRSIVVSGEYSTISLSGSSMFGGSKTGLTANPGVNADSYGAGGGAAGAATADNRAGGNGYQGVCIIEEFF